MNTRTPSEARPPRMEALARLPVFYRAGGQARGRRGRQRGRGVEGRAAGRRRRRGRGLRRRSGRRDDRDRAASEHRDPSPRHRSGRSRRRRAGRSARSRTTREAAAFAALARRAGVPVNVIDKPAFCDFSFGSIVNRSPLVIGISTDGAAPVFGQAIRAKLEALDPARLCALGGGRAAMAPARAGARAVVPRAAPLLGEVHRARGRRAGARARGRATSTR